MKQNYALKAMALGLTAFAALSASALRPQVPANFKKPQMAKISLNADVQSKSMVRTAKVPAKYSSLASHVVRPALQELDLTAQPLSRAINPYGEWEDAGTLDYTFTQLYKNEFIKESAMVKTYAYQKRIHRQNEQNFQIKVENWGAFTADETTAGLEMPGSELLLTVTPVTTSSGSVVGVVTTEKEGVDLGWQVQFGSATSSVLVDMYYYDAYTWMQNYAEINPQITAQIIASYYGSSLYDYNSGFFDLFPSYGGQAGTENIEASLEWGDYVQGQGYSAYWDDEIQLSGKFYNYDFDVDTDAGYFYRNAGQTVGYYKAPFELNDNILGVAKVIKGEMTTEEELNGAINEMIGAINNPTPDMAVFTTPDGWFDVEIADYADGEYTIIYAVGKEQTAEGIDMKFYYATLYLDGAEYVLDGFAKYQDSFITGFISAFGDASGNPLTPEQVGLTSTYSTTCSVEKSETDEGCYRLRAPYAQLQILSSQFGYNQKLDYLYYDVSNPAAPMISPSLTGLYITLGQAGYWMGGSTLNVFKTESLGIDAAEFNGTFADQKLTFPVGNKDFTFTEEGETYTEAFGPLTTLLYDLQTLQFKTFLTSLNPDHFLIEMGATDAIKNVEADAVADTNAPVEYFNLQGQKVMSPAAGQLVIKKQGGKVSKMIVR